MRLGNTLRRAAVSAFGFGGINTSSVRHTSQNAISNLNCGNVAPSCQILLPSTPASATVWATNSGCNAYTLFDRNPRPAARSGCSAFN